MRFLKTMSYREYKSLQRHRNKMKTRENKSVSDDMVSPPDKSLIIIVTFLVIIGFLAIFSATAPKCMREGVSLVSFLIKQLVYAIAGFLAMGFFANFDYKKLEKYNVKFLWIVGILLFLVDFTPLEINGAKRWLGLGPLQLQPSEFAKPLFCMILASAFKDKVRLLDTDTICKIYIPLLVILFMIFKQPNLSMVIILCVTGLGLYIAAGGPLILLGIGGGIVGAGILAIIPKLLHGYQMDRITIWLNPGSDAQGKGYNIIQSLIAFASGGFSGTGYGGSIQKLAYLPECHTDFIFSIIAEEFGWLGCIFIIGLFAALVHRGMRAIGITFIFGFQAFLNMSVASSLLPVTGVTLPFISYGGTSIVVFLAMSGILLNISKQRSKRVRADINE